MKSGSKAPPALVPKYGGHGVQKLLTAVYSGIRGFIIFTVTQQQGNKIIVTYSITTYYFELTNRSEVEPDGVNSTKKSLFISNRTLWTDTN